VGGFAHQGYVGCAWCGVDLGTKHSMELYKEIYLGTQRWLLTNHPYCSERMEDHFDGKLET